MLAILSYLSLILTCEPCKLHVFLVVYYTCLLACRKVANRELDHLHNFPSNLPTLQSFNLHQHTNTPTRCILSLRHTTASRQLAPRYYPSKNPSLGSRPSCLTKIRS